MTVEVTHAVAQMERGETNALRSKHAEKRAREAPLSVICSLGFARFSPVDNPAAAGVSFSAAGTGPGQQRGGWASGS